VVLGGGGRFLMSEVPLCSFDVIQVTPFGSIVSGPLGRVHVVQGYLAYKEPPHPSTLQ